MIVPTTSQTALLTLETARTLLTRDHDAILDLVDSGKLRWAFDIGITGKPPRCIRVWGYSISCFQRSVADEDNIETVLAAVLLGRRARLRASELTHRLSCSHDHLSRLVEGRRISGGVENHTLWLNRDSLARFLKSRVIGGHASCNAMQTGSCPQRAITAGSVGSGLRAPINDSGGLSPSHAENTQPRLKR